MFEALDTEPAVSYNQEPLGRWVPDAQHLIPEEAAERGMAPLDPQGEAYLQAEQRGQLITLVARGWGGEVIGYLLYMLYIHRHYSLLAADPDLFYVDRRWRNAPEQVGRNLLVYGEAALKARGVKLLCARVPCGARHGKFYQRLGFDEVETLYVKKL